MDFEYSQKVKDLQSRIGEFMDEHIYPNENIFFEQIETNRKNGNAWIPTEVVEEKRFKQERQAFGIYGGHNRTVAR